MFKDCARLERDVFVTWKECDVGEQDVGEKKEFFFFFFSSLSACSLWLWHCLDAVCMLSYM